MSLSLILDLWDPGRGGLEHYASELSKVCRRSFEAFRIVCGKARAEAPAPLLELGARGPAFYRRVDEKAGELGLCLSFRHPGESARVFLPLGGLLASSLAARRRFEPLWKRGPRALARALDPKTRFYLDRERRFFEDGDPDRLVLANSEQVAAEVRARFPGYRGRLEVVGLPVDEERYRPAGPEERARQRRLTLGGRAGGPILLWIGNDPVRKGLKSALGVLRRFRLRKMDATLLLAGHGTRERYGRVPGVVGLGFVEDMRPLYGSANLLLAPSLEDNLSLVALEALASGLPVVTTARNGASMFLEDPEVGRVVEDPRDVHALDGACLALCQQTALEPRAMEKRRAAVRSCFREAHLEGVLGLLRTLA